MSGNFNTLLAENKNGLVDFRTDASKLSEFWKNVQDAVDYPVSIQDAYWKDENNEFHNACGQTGTGRDKDFMLVVVDMLRNGNRQVISTVTGRYGTIDTSNMYRLLEEELVGAKIKHEPVRLWVSGNGGRQQLTVHIKDQIGFSGLPDDLRMHIRLDTSVDGSCAHGMRTIIYNKTAESSYQMKEAEIDLSARHTTTIDERSVHFIPFINNMIQNWNDLIMPTMSLMFDSKYDREMSLELLEEICNKAKMGKRHTARIVELYTSDKVRTNDNSDSLYRINHTINEYIDDELSDEKVETAERFKTLIAKNIQNEINKIRRKKG